MTSPESVRQELGCEPANLAPRLSAAYIDEFVHDKFRSIMAGGEDEDSERAQLDAYLAAGYAIFPEEAKIIQDSIKSTRHG